MSETLGLTEAVAIGLGGMIGGGIYAVLGVVAQITGPATWFAFVLAGVVALASGYSYIKLNEIDDNNRGGSVSFVQCFIGNSTLAGMIGWTLLFGYVGSMAMYAFAFGEFALAFAVVPESLGVVPLRPIVSILAVGGFVALNLLGARASGVTETVLVVIKVLVLFAFGVAGLLAIPHVTGHGIDLGVSRIPAFGPIMAAAVSFVAFQGWQLLFYDQESVKNPEDTIPRAVYFSIPASVLIYVLVAVATFNLAPDALEATPHTALANAAEAVLSVVGFGQLGFVIISLSALFSTGSAINATLFSTGYFAKGLIGNDLLPDRVGDSSSTGIPERTLLGIGIVTAALSAYGTLEAITAFASVSFIVVFGAMSVLALTQRDHPAVNPIPPAIGAVGSLGFFPLMFYHLYRAERGTFYAVILLAATVIAVELLYFERDVLAREIVPFEPHGEHAE